MANASCWSLVSPARFRVLGEGHLDLLSSGYNKEVIQCVSPGPGETWRLWTQAREAQEEAPQGRAGSQDLEGSPSVLLSAGATAGRAQARLAQGGALCVPRACMHVGPGFFFFKVAFMDI